MGPVRSRLIDKGLLYTPEYGYAAFTVPQFDRYVLRHTPTSREPSPSAARGANGRLATSPTDG